MEHRVDLSAGASILLFVMPFAAQAGVKHTEKLIDCLAPGCRELRIVGDRRITLPHRSSHISRQGRIPTLHHLPPRRTLRHTLLWLLRLAVILLRASWAVVETRREIDIVICFQSLYYTPVLLMARLLGKQTIVFEAGDDVANAVIGYHGRPWAATLVRGFRLLRCLNRRLTHICAVESLYLVAPMGLEPYRAKLRVAHLFVDRDCYRMIVPLPLRRPIVGFVGRLSTGKGIRELLEAAASMRGHGISFVVVGDGPLREEIREALRRPELAHVELVGWAAQDELVAHLNRFRLLVLPSASEGLPNVVLEAMACGTPVLATPVGGIPDLITHEVTGFILDDCEPLTIERGIRFALDHSDLAEIAERGRQHVLARYSRGAAGERWRLLLQALSAKPRYQPRVSRR